MMKKVFLILGMVLLSVVVYAQSGIKTYETKVDKDDVDELVISNRYGNIEVVQNKKEFVEVAVTISVMAKNQRKVDELIEYISIRENLDEMILTLETEFLKNMKYKQMFSQTTLSIDYKITIPWGVNLRIVNTEGTISLGDFDGDLNVQIESCDFRGGKIVGGELQVRQQGGSFVIDEAELMRGEFKSATLNVSVVDNLKLGVDKCDVRINEVDKLNIISRGGTVTLGEVDRMSGSASATRYEIEDIGDVLKMNMSRGAIQVANILQDFTSVELKASSAKVGLTFMEGSGYYLELKHNSALKPTLPYEYKLSGQPTLEKKKELKTGFVGNAGKEGKVALDLNKGSLYIQQDIP